MSTSTIPGYTFGSDQLARSPLSLDDLELLEQSVLWSDEDDRYLRLSGEVLESQVEQVLDVWYGFVASHPFLSRSSTRSRPRSDRSSPRRGTATRRSRRCRTRGASR